jgi:hypothetical protein
MATSSETDARIKSIRRNDQSRRFAKVPVGKLLMYEETGVQLDLLSMIATQSGAELIISAKVARN